MHNAVSAKGMLQPLLVPARSPKATALRLTFAPSGGNTEEERP